MDEGELADMMTARREPNPPIGHGWRDDEREPTGIGCLCGKEDWEARTSHYSCKGCGGIVDFEDVDRHNQERYENWLDDHGVCCFTCGGEAYDPDTDSYCPKCEGYGMTPSCRLPDNIKYPGPYINYGKPQ
jgi:hypothetical protein